MSSTATIHDGGILDTPASTAAGERWLDLTPEPANPNVRFAPPYISQKKLLLHTYMGRLAPTFGDAVSAKHNV
jgi:hypothetical protein